MALSTKQKVKILRSLCYPRGTLDNTSLDYSKIVSDKLDQIDGEDQNEVEQLLEWIDETETEIDKAIASGRVKRVDDIEFFENQSDVLRSEKKRYLNELSDFIGIPNKCKGGGAMGCVCI